LLEDIVHSKQRTFQSYNNIVTANEQVFKNIQSMEAEIAALQSALDTQLALQMEYGRHMEEISLRLTESDHRISGLCIRYAFYFNGLLFTVV
jgi:hypothetical protein